MHSLFYSATRVNQDIWYWKAYLIKQNGNGKIESELNKSKVEKMEMFKYKVEL